MSMFDDFIEVYRRGVPAVRSVVFPILFYFCPRLHLGEMGKNRKKKGSLWSFLTALASLGGHK